MKYQDVVAMFEDKGAEPLEVLRALDGYYNCPRDASGLPLGPLVGYAAEYEPGKHFVGFAYANWAKAEPYPFILQDFAQRLGDDLETKANMPDVYCGVAMGGIVFARDLATIHCARSIFAEKVEKKDLETAKDGQREKSKMVLGRHEIIYPGETVAVVEDVCNNFFSTKQVIELIRSAGGNVVAIVCLLNRSPDVDTAYSLNESEEPIPVISLVRQAIPEFRQDDQQVAQMIADGRVVWKAKDHWDELEAVMAANS